MPGPSIYDVADRAGVSIATVSRVFRGNGRVADSTRVRVLEAAEELQWTPSSVARGLARREHGTVAIVFPDVSGPYFSEVIRGFDAAAAADDRSVLLIAAHGKPNTDALARDLARRVDGMAAMGSTISDDTVAALAESVPFVLMARPPIPGVPSVRAENVQSARALTMHLLVDHRYESVGFLGNPDAAPDVAERWSGFLQAHHDARRGAPDKPVLVSGFSHDDGVRAAHQLLARERRPRALVCANDEAAIAVVGAARDTDVRVPADLALTGWDDIPSAGAFTPALTTVHQPMRELGSLTGGMLLQRLAGQTLDEPGPVLPTNVIVRHSCGC